jgi:hypothetical protein
MKRVTLHNAAQQNPDDERQRYILTVMLSRKVEYEQSRTVEIVSFEPTLSDRDCEEIWETHFPDEEDLNRDFATEEHSDHQEEVMSVATLSTRCPFTEDMFS